MRRLAISFEGLLSIYAVIPLCLLTVLLDLGPFHGALRRALPESPESLRVLTIFIVVPHIVASALSFAEREYLSFYKQRLLWAIPLVLGVVYVLPRFSTTASAMVYASYTIFHTMAQQVGMTSLMVGKPTTAFKLWKWMTIGVSWLVYVVLFGELDQLPGLDSHDGQRLFFAGLYFLCIPLAYVTWRVGLSSRTSTGRAYLWANFGMILAAVFFQTAGYPFFTILAPRLIHDLSGFYFYVVHDHNRNLDQPRNLVLRLFRFTRLPVVVVSPLVAILLANLLMELRGPLPVVSNLMMSLGFFHYYSEGFMWKRESIHRLSLGAITPTPAAQPIRLSTL